MTTTSLAPLQFHKTTLHPVVIDGKQWFTANEIGEALGFANPRKAVNEIYNRNAVEFNESMTFVRNLRTNPEFATAVTVSVSADKSAEQANLGGNPTSRVYSLRGMHMISLKAYTPRAAEFRVWVLDVIEGKATGVAPADIASGFTQGDRAVLHSIGDGIQMLAKAVGVLVTQTDTTVKYIDVLEQNQRGWAKVNRDVEFEVCQMYLNGHAQADIRRRLKLSGGTVSNLVNGKYKFSPGVGAPHPAIAQMRTEIANRGLKHHTQQTLCYMARAAQGLGSKQEGVQHGN